MAVYGNFKGTTQPGFTVGKTGAASIYGNPSSAPSSPTAGDVWMDSANVALRIYDGTEWSEGTFIGNLDGHLELEAVAGENLSKGDVVYVSGSSGNTPEVSKARSNSTTTMPAIGIVKDGSINSGNRGYVVVQGVITGINTSVYSEGDVLYVSDSVAGSFQNTAPTGESNRIQNVGKVIRSANGGSILVTGAGRFNATNALDSGNIFIGNGSNQAVTAPLDTSISDLGYLKNVVEDATPELGGNLDANNNDLSNINLVRINENGTGMRMTNVGAFDNSNGDFRIFSNGNLILSTDGDNGTAVTFDQTTKDATFAGTITVHNEYTLPDADGSANQYLQTDGSGNISFADGPIGYTGSRGTDAYGIVYNFDTSTTSGDPGSGDFRFSIAWTSGSPGTSYEAYVSDTDANGTGVLSLLNTLDDSTNDNKALCVLSKKSDPTVNAKFYVTGFTTSTGWRTLDVVYIDRDNWTSVNNGDEMFMSISIIGDQGDTGFTGSVGFTGSQGVGFTGSKGESGFTGSKGFTGSQGDIGYTGSQGQQGVIGYTGSQGIQGNIGYTGSQGDQGNVGFTGSQGDASVIGGYVFTQSSAATTWTVNHNLGQQYVNVEVVNSNGESLAGTMNYPVIDFTSTTQLTATFATGTSGYLVASAGSGYQGSQGTTGFTGSQGTIGFTGSKGDTGFTGSASTVAGPTGFTGSRGDTGFTGSVGFTGSQGGFGGATFEYDWSTDTTVSDPGAGNVKINNANLTAGTILSIDDTDAQGTDIQQFLRTIDDSTSAIKGHFRMANKLNADDFALYTISAISEETGYFEVTVSYVDGSATSFTNGEELIMTFARTGDKGDTGFTGSTGDTGFNGSVGFTGSKGDQGVTGFTGSSGLTSSFTVDADSGTSQPIGNGDTLRILGGTNLSSIVSGTDIVTINFDGGLTVSDFDTNSILLTGETFVDTDGNIMTAAAINDLIVGKGYGVGTITEVAAGNALTGGGTSGTVTLNVSGITVSEIAPASLQLSSESFVNSDAVLMTAAAVEGRIVNKGYTTNTGTVTNIGTSGSINGITLTGGPITTSGTISLSGALSGIRLDQLIAGNVITSAESFVDTDDQIMTAAAIDDLILSKGYGDITEVVAGTALTGGGSSGSVTLDVSDITTSEIQAASLQTSGEGFTDSDTILMTAAAIDDRILSYGYTTNVGDITGVTAGTALTGGGTSGDVTLNVSGITTTEIDSASLQTSGEGFTDSDTILMTAAAIDDRILSYSYVTGLTLQQVTDAGASTDNNIVLGDGNDITMDGTAAGQLKVDGDGYSGAIALDGTSMYIYHNSSSRNLVLGTNETARLTIAGTGDVTIANKLTVSGSGGVQTTNLTSGSNATAGTVTGDWTLTAGSTWEATYADLAEKYTTDGPYEAGTVMKFGGDAELTQSDSINDTRVAGVISTAPAFTMNGGIDGSYLALAGRVPVKVVGDVQPGDMLVASSTPGHAQTNNKPDVGTVIGKAITGNVDGMCEALVILM